MILICEMNISNTNNVPINYEIYISKIIENIHIQKEQWEPILINIGYNLIYFISLCQIQYNKIKTIVSPMINTMYLYINNYLKDNGIMIETKSKMFILIDHNGNEIRELVMKNTNDKELLEISNNELEYSSILFLDKNNMGYSNCIFYQTFPESFNYEVSEINFMAIELEHNNKKYVIKLKPEYYNFCIVNNYLNRYFFKYYIKNVLKITINSENFDYTVTIIDHDINVITLLPHQYILLGKNSYKICNELNTSDTNNDSDSSDDFINLERGETF